ncbi:MAG: hypothetical protein ABW211_06870, partial [Acidimicrobiia bacterium]
VDEPRRDDQAGRVDLPPGLQGGDPADGGDPAAAGRDVALLRDLGYQPVESVVVDLFPHTHHTETVTRLDRA